MPKEFDKNLTPVKIEKRIDRLIDEIIYSEDGSWFGMIYLLFKVIQLFAIYQVSYHKEKYHREKAKNKRR